MISLNGYEIKPTIFPDKTSQIWKIPEEALQECHRKKHTTIVWKFESESELIHVAQLKSLLDHEKIERVTLRMTYLPYARQDKPVANNASFALTPFASLINSMRFYDVEALDPHSSKASIKIDRFTSISPANRINYLLKETGYKPCAPDKGAKERYFDKQDIIYADKIRNQLTGDIEGLKLCHERVQGNFLIIDDICDGGRTFIEMAKALYAAGASSVHLYVTHGIFSKGIEPLKEAGIRRIFTYDKEF